MPRAPWSQQDRRIRSSADGFHRDRRERLGGGVSVRVVPELTEHPGAENDTESWQGEVDVGVRVCLKMLGQRDLELGDLAVELDDDGDRGAGGGGECGIDRCRCPELLAA